MSNKKPGIFNLNKSLRFNNSDKDKKKEVITEISNGFICGKCNENYFKIKFLINTPIKTTQNSSSEDDEDALGFDLNPDMDEEPCSRCLNKMINTPSKCTVNGINK
jgi:hypothetical protein